MRRRSTMAGIAAVVAAAGLSACGGNSTAAADRPEPKVAGQLEVVNRSASDMDVYLVRGSQRIRLGLAPNGTTTRFTLVPGQVVGVDLLRFEAVPLLGLGRVASSEPVKLSPNDVVRLDIPPP
jgi:hypothetical protein